jgi:hypothetical protein
MFCICEDEKIKLDCNHQVCINCIKKFIKHLGHICPICGEAYSNLRIINTLEEKVMSNKLNIISDDDLNKYIIFFDNKNKNKIKTKLYQKYLKFDILSGPEFRRQKILNSFNNCKISIIMINKEENHNFKEDNIIKIYI